MMRRGGEKGRWEMRRVKGRRERIGRRAVGKVERVIKQGSMRKRVAAETRAFRSSDEIERVVREMGAQLERATRSE